MTMSAMTNALPQLAAAGPKPVETGQPVVPAQRLEFLKASRRSIPAVQAVAAADAVVLMTALLVGGQRSVNWPASVGELLSVPVAIGDLGLLAAFALTVVAVFEIAGLYEAALVRRQPDEARRLVAATGVVAFLTGVAKSMGPAPLDWPLMLQFWAAGFVAAASARAIRSRLTRSAAGTRRALIVGSGPHALRICRELSTDPLTTYQVVGFVDTNLAPRSAFVTRRTLGTLDELESILVAQHIDEVHVGLPVKSHYHDIQETIRVCERIGVKLMYGADIFGTQLARPCVSMPGVSPRIELQVVAEGPAVFVKRLVDIVGAAVALVVLSPIMLAAALAVKLTSEGPIIFSQERCGLNRRRFRMLKFRTMVVNAEALQAALESQNEVQGAAFKIARDPRITPIGRILRRTSIDELPQLINVLRGDMSLIGPRPLPNRDVSRFTRTTDMRRFSVRPGCTGLWQVSGRARLVFDEWIRLDLHYIDNWSLLLDFRILARTIPAVVRGEGAA
jgi:exopolysaccharide biosynthesis polyprenyl glycosylphosphotransferase